MFGRWTWLLVLTAAIPAQSSRDSALRREFLAAHNAVRAVHQLPQLEWSDKLAAHARDWATTLVVRSQFRHSPDLPFGENLYEIRGGKASPAKVVHAWAAEVQDYDYRWNRCRSAMCGHYTQIVWRDTRAVGCAVSRSSFREVWVCEYSPPGNVMGQRPY